MPNQSISTLIRQALAHKLETPREAAAAIGVSHQSVRNWLSGELPKPENIAGLAAYVGTSLDELWALFTHEHLARLERMKP